MKQATHSMRSKGSMNICAPHETARRLTRREFLGAGSSAVATAVLARADSFDQRYLARQPVDDVDPFIGTTSPGLRWLIFPGVAMPFGMVKLSPDNRVSPDDMRGQGRAGYDYKIPTILGFSHIHSWTMGGLLTMPATGPLKTVQVLPTPLAGPAMRAPFMLGPRFHP